MGRSASGVRGGGVVSVDYSHAKARSLAASHLFSSGLLLSASFPLRCCGTGRPPCGDALKHSAGTDVFVDFRPVDALAVTDNLEVLALLGCGVRESPRPSQGHTDGPAVG